MSFGAGVSSANITVPITNDTAFEGNETFTVALGFPSPVDMLLGAIATTTVTIVDNDVPATVAFGAASYSVSEGTASIVIPVIRSSTTGTASVAFATANGTATAGSDYTARSGTLAFAAGIGSMNISVPITNDTAADGNETFTVSLSAPVSLVLGSPIMTTVSIIDNDVPAQSRLSVYRYGLGGVTSTPAGIDCNPPRPASFLPTLCNVSFPSGGSVNLQATPMPGWAFVAWSGACTGTNPVCTVSMTSAKSAVAIFRTDSALGSAVESPSLPWVTDGNNVWAAQSGTWVVGGSALQSGVIDHSQATSVRTTVTGPGLLTFRWRVSSEANFDFLLLIFDGWEQAGISGDSGWQQQTWFVPEGPHELGWTYRKDSSVVRLSDAGWLDEVIFTPGTGFSSAGKALSATRSSAPTRQTFGPVLPKP